MKQEILPKNRRVLESRLPQLAQRLEDLPGEEEEIELFRSRTGPMTCRALGSGGRWITFHSTVDPVAESRRFIERFGPPDEGIVVLLGIGLGYPLSALAQGEETEGRVLVVVERDPSLFKSALGLFDWTDLLKRKDIHWLVGEEPSGVLKYITGLRIREGFPKVVLIPHEPSIRRNPDFYEPLVRELKFLEVSPFGRQRVRGKPKRGPLSVLILDTGYFLVRECAKTLRRLGHEVLSVPVSRGRVVETILGHVARARPDFLLSVNHLGFDEEGKLSGLLGALKIPHAVWYVDSPTFIIKNSERIVSPYCALFLWDQTYLEPMKRYGFHKAHYLPLATDPSVFKPIPRSGIPGPFRAEVSFVGNSMLEAVKDWFGRFPNDSATEGVSRLAIRLQKRNHQQAIGEILETIAREHDLRVQFRDPVHLLNFQAALVWKATLEYRRDLIQHLDIFPIRVFGDKGWREILNGGIRVSGPVNYYRELPLVFNGTDVNLNATSFQMNAAVNQRVFDVAACGAFLLTDHQPDMESLFDPEREAVCYRDTGQAREQVAYYLKHPEERRRIAERARQRILAEHTYTHRIQRMIRVMREEFGSF